MNYKIINIHTSDRKPGEIYASLVEEESGQLEIGATLQYIIKQILIRNLTVSNYKHWHHNGGH